MILAFHFISQIYFRHGIIPFVLGTFALVAQVLAVCDSECSSVTDLLATCDIPNFIPDPNSVNWTLSPVDITGLSFGFYEQGPYTYAVTNQSQAACFCTDGIHGLTTCFKCLYDSPDLSYYNNSQIVGAYGSDCLNFGYFDNTTLGEPTNTADTLPTQTSTINKEGCDICGVIDNQLEECDLLPLDSSPPRTATRLYSFGSSAAGLSNWLLLNRTAAECFCTLPVLRRSYACDLCFPSDSNAWSMMNFYIQDCNSMGYWSDDKAFPPTETATPSATASTSSQGPTGTQFQANSASYSESSFWWFLPFVVMVYI
jgi:hypothetical protein